MNRQSFLMTVLRIIGLCTFVYAHAAQAAVPPNRIHALWVYPQQPSTDPILNAAAGQQLIANARASKVNMIYLSVYQSTPNSKGRYMYNETLLANFIAAAHVAGMEVYAAYGDPGWPTLGCGTAGNPSFPIARLLEVAAYNAANPSAMVHDPVINVSFRYPGTFSGVILDVEPSTADQSLLTLYACSLQTTRQNHLGLSVAINAFWNNTIGTGGLAYRQILNMDFNNVVIMGYRSFAGTFGASDNGIIALDTPAVTYKNDGTTVLVGLETQNLGASDPNNTQSFYASGQAALDYQAQSVYNQFWANGYDFGGLAIDNYADAYLGGAANWPSTNPTFPTGVSVEPVSAGVPAHVSIGTVTAAITFPHISNSHATVTVTPLNPATQTPTPTGFQLTNLAFDVSTTAAFTGPVTVCFTVPSLDAATFASLRVLHYVGGVPADQTILSGPNAPNPTTQTICASVTSFSPFVLAKTTSAAVPAFHVHAFTIEKDDFHLEGDFMLPANTQVTAGDAISLTLGTVVLKVPAGQLKQDGDDDHFTFEGPVNGGAQLHIGFDRDRDQSYDFTIDCQHLDLTTQAEPMLVQLQIGKYLGSATVFASVHK